MVDQRSSGRRLVRWRAAVIPTHAPQTVIEAYATEVAAKSLSLFCTQQLFPNFSYRILLQIPDPAHIAATYVEVVGKPVHSSLVGHLGEYRTGLKLIETSPGYQSKIEQMLRTF